MIKRLIILLFFLPVMFCLADNVLEDFQEETETIDQYMEKTIPVLNEELRRLRKRGIDTDTDELASVSANDTTAGYLNGKLVAGTDISFTEGSDGGDETLTIDFDGTSDTNLSNVIWTFGGCGYYSANNYGMYQGTALQPNAIGATITYMAWAADGTSNQDLINFKYKHSGDVSTVTGYGMGACGTAGTTMTIQFTIGGQTATATVAGTALVWSSGGAVDVSGLTPGTVYDASIGIKTSGAGVGVYLYYTTGIAS